MSVLKFLGFPTMVILVTLWWIWLDRLVGWQGIRSPTAAVILGGTGTALISWCTILFAMQGDGTPHPLVAKTRKLVVEGPYRVVRNPMMYGVGMILVALALWLGSVGLWFGLACFILFLSWFVPHYEEPDMERRFGEEYRRYCRRVPRWIP